MDKNKEKLLKITQRRQKKCRTEKYFKTTKKLVKESLEEDNENRGIKIYFAKKMNDSQMNRLKENGKSENEFSKY
jgi:hypothetical protein